MARSTAPDDPWGTDDPPAVVDPPPLPPHLAELAALTGPREVPPGQRAVHPRPDELPEVQELMAAGWRVANRSPMWSFLPAVWPPDLRCWVPDRVPRFSRSRTRDDVVVVTPWNPSTAEDMRSNLAEMTERVGLPPPPPDRIWLLRSPWPSIGVEPLQGMIALLAHEHGGRGMLDAVLVDAARELLGWDEEQAWAWWPGDWGNVARAWRAAGRTGEDAAPLIIAKLSPELLDAFHHEGFDEAEALDWMLALSAGGSTALQRATAWRELGYAPSDVLVGLMDRDPADVGEWLDAGFSLSDVRAFKGGPLEVAKAWRAAGVPPREAVELLWLDRMLTPDEARRFTDLGITPEERQDWVRFGFDADAARGWTDLDVFPTEARVWRAAGHDPASAAAVIGEIPPDGPRIPVGQYPWSMTVSPSSYRPDETIDFTDPEVRRALYWSVDDPPDTRGEKAELRRPPDP